MNKSYCYAKDIQQVNIWSFFVLKLVSFVNEIPKNQDPGPYDDPDLYEDPAPWEDPGHYEDAELYENLEFLTAVC